MGCLGHVIDAFDANKGGPVPDYGEHRVHSVDRDAAQDMWADPAAPISPNRLIPYGQCLLIPHEDATAAQPGTREPEADPRALHGLVEVVLRTGRWCVD
jgi:hypothetical protein